MKSFRQLLTLASGALLLFAPHASAQGDVLLREVVSREHSVHVGGVESSPPQQAVSREFSIHIENGAQALIGQVVSRELDLLVSSAAAPPALTGVQVNVSPTGETASLDWSSYNQWAVGDIQRFDVYYSPSGAFTNVEGLTPYASVGGGTTSITLTGLAANQDHYFAVVAVDGLGNFLPSVNYAAAYVISPQVISREFSLFIGLESQPSYREIISRELDLAITSPAPPPAITDVAVSVTASGESATLDWSAYNQWAVGDIQRFDIYLSDAGAFSSVEGLTPFLSVGGGSTTATLSGLLAGTDHFFAVVPVDALGNFNPTVSYSAAYVLSPQAVSREFSLYIGQEPAVPYREMVSRELSVAVPDAAVPAPVTGLGSGFTATTSTTAFSAVDLDWSTYNELAQNDVSRYRIYVSTAFFEDVTGLTPFAFTQTGNQRQVLTGLGGGEILHFAVVAEDVLGNFNSAVRSFSALSSISGVGEVVNLAGVSGADSLTFTWQAPPDTGAFLTGYRIYFGGVLAEELPPGTTVWTRSGLAAATGYPFRITTIDPFGGESSGVSLTAATLLPNPTNVRLTAQGASVAMLWDVVQPTGLVSRYDLYLSGSSFTNVSAAQLVATVTGPLAILGTFAEVSGQHYAVVAVNPLGGFRSQVVSVEATKQSQTITFTQPLAGPLQIPLIATASSGLPVIFSASPGQTASVDGSTLIVNRGGQVTVTATQAGDEDFWPASATRQLRLPPVITSFTTNGAAIRDEMIFSAAAVPVAVTALDATGIARAEFFGRLPGDDEWLPWSTDTTPADGLTAMIPVASYPDGEYGLRVVVTTTDGNSAERVNDVFFSLAPVLSLTLTDAILIEGSTLEGQVSIPRARTTDLIVTLSASNVARVTAGPPVTILGGQTTANFTLSAPQDIQIQSMTDVRITATAAGATAATENITLLDDDLPILTLTLDRTLVTESAGPNGVIATVTRTPATALPLTVGLVNSDPAAANIPPSVIIPTGETSVSFPIGVVDDAASDGLQTAVLKAQLTLAGNVISESTPVELQVADDEGPRLEFSYPQGWILEGQSGQVTIRRIDAATTAALVVSLSAVPAGQLTFPASATIPAGQTQATFTVQATADSTADGSMPVLIGGEAAGVSPGQIEIIATDLSLADLVAKNLTAPLTADTEANFNVSYRIENIGAAANDAPFTQRVLLSTDPVPGNDVLLSQFVFSGTLNQGVGFDRTEQVRAPRTAGTYWLLVTTDATGAVGEILETNNTVLSSQPITVGAAYAGNVQTQAVQVPANTPIPLTGSATKTGGIKVPFVMVNIHIRVAGTERIIAAITNSAGDFSTIWNPLPGEGGDYEIGAAHPGAAVAATQDEFAILTAKTDFPDEAITFDEGGTATFTGNLTNPTAYDLTGLTLAAIDAPAGLTVQMNLPGTTLVPGASLQAGVALTGASGFSGTHVITLRLTTDQGVVLNIPVTVTVRALVPLLTIEPAPLKASVLRGEQKSVSFTISNSGGAATGPIELLLPQVPWIQLASPGSLPSIEPGASASVSLLLSPAATQALTLYNGTLMIDPATGASRSLPFEFRVVSALTGDLQIDVVDESFFFTAAAPKVVGATVTLRDAITAETISSVETTADGSVTFSAIPEGWYTVEAGSPGHTGWKGNLYVNAGERNFRQVFITREWVTYSWNVEEIELEDRYKITVETTFETNVPAPVLVVTPSVLDLEDMVVPGQTKVINFTIENLGFIAANNSAMSFPDHPLYRVTPLIGDFGTIPAKSSITVPVTVERLGGGAAARNIAARSGGSIPCGYAGRIEWDYLCGFIPVAKSVSIAASGAVTGDCGGSPWHPSGSGSGGGTFSAVGVSSSSGNCPDKCWLDILFNLAFKLVPDSPAKNWAGCALSASSFADDAGFYNLGKALYDCGCALGQVIPGTAVAAKGFCDSTQYITCIIDLAICIDKQNSGGGSQRARAVQSGSRPPKLISDSVAAGLGEIDAAWAESIVNLGRMIDLYIYFTGSLEAYEVSLSEAGLRWNSAFSDAIQDDSPGGKSITPAEEAAMLQIIAEDNLPLECLQTQIRRWKTTDELVSNGIFNEADAPADKRADFIARDVYTQLADESLAAFALSEAIGYQDPMDQLVRVTRATADALRGEDAGVCAKVKVRLDQEAVMTRSAFRASLELANNLTNGPLSAVDFDLGVRDAAGNDATEFFNIQVTRLTGLSAIDGSAQIGPQSVGTVQWTLIPRDTAAPLADTVYTIGGTIRYDQGGTAFSIPVTPVPITVRPDAALYLKYFHQRDVFSDDPHTDPIEPSVPYALAVMVENRGAGAARNLKITSAQPEIVDNEKGLLIDFQVIGTEVAGQNLSPSLTADFGLLDGGSRKIATWLMTSSLQGLFTDYDATFQHLDSFGDDRLSLIKEVEIHEMIRIIGDASGQPAFLVNDIADINDTADTVHLADGSTAAVTILNAGSVSGPVSPASLSVTLTTTPGSGWTYLRVVDPGLGNFRLSSVTRSDGRVIPLDRNVWTTDRTFIGLGRRPIYENIMHLADFGSTGSYTLRYSALPEADTTAPVSQVAALPLQSGISIPVRWSGSDDRGIASYDLFVRTDGGPWQPWLVATTRTSAIYTGAPGGEYGFYSVAKDAAGNVQSRAATADATTQVSLVNLPPVIAPVGERIIAEGSSLALQLTASDLDGPAEELSFRISSPVAGITVTDSGLLRWVTGESDGGTQADVTVTVTDAGSPAASASMIVRLTVPESNSPPRVLAIGPQSAEVGNLLSLRVPANDTDLPEQTLGFALAAGSPPGMTINPTTGGVNWMPKGEDAGRAYAVRVIVTDSGNPAASSFAEFSVNVLTLPNRPPVFQPLPPLLWLQLPASSPVLSRSVPVQASDADGDPISLSATLSGILNSPLFGTAAGSGSGIFSWDTRGIPSGTYRIPLSASDGKTATSASLVIRLEPDNEYWRWALDSLDGVADSANFAMTADPDGDGMTNVFEMTFLRDPQRQDHTPMKFTPAGTFGNAFRIYDLDFKRHRDSAKFVEIWPSKSPGLNSWNRLATGEWQFFIDPQGNTDGRAETQDLRWRIYAPVTEPSMFYRVEGRVKP